MRDSPVGWRSGASVSIRYSDRGVGAGCGVEPPCIPEYRDLNII